jgi:hypothetical protein
VGPDHGRFVVIGDAWVIDRAMERGAWAPTLPQQECAVLAAVGVNSILGTRFATSLFHQPKARIPDDRYLTEWTALLATRIETLS